MMNVNATAAALTTTFAAAIADGTPKATLTEARALVAEMGREGIAALDVVFLNGVDAARAIFTREARREALRVLARQMNAARRAARALAC